MRGSVVPRLLPSPRRHRTGRRSDSEAGLTLIEVIVSLLILGVILTASAASLITFTQSARQNERQVQATALLSRAHEEFQSRPWETLGNLDDDLVGLDSVDHLGAALVVEVDTETYLFTGDDAIQREVIITENPDDAIPAYSGPFTADDGRDYELYQIITWVDRTGNGNPDLKRLTAIVRWSIGQRPFEQTFVSERAPSVQEAGDVAFPRLLQYDLFPIQQTISPTAVCPFEATNPESVQVAARFSDGVANVRLEFYSVDVVASFDAGDVVLQEQSVPFGDAVIANPFGDGGVYFVTEIPAGLYVFPEGPRPLRVVAETVPEGIEFTAGTRNLDFLYVIDPDELPDTCSPPLDVPWPPTADPGGDGGDDGFPDLGDTVILGPLSVNPATPVRLRNDQGSRLTCEPVQVNFTISSGLEEGDSVQLNYFTGQQGNTPQSRTLSDQELAIGFVRFDAGIDHGWRNNTATAFSILVLRDGNVVGASVSSPIVSFQNTNNC